MQKMVNLRTRTRKKNQTPAGALKKGGGKKGCVEQWLWEKKGGYPLWQVVVAQMVPEKIKRTKKELSS